MSKIKKLKKKHRVLRWLKKLLGIQSPTEPRNWPYDIDEVHELVDIDAERARALQAASRKVGSITLGVEVKRCDKCNRTEVVRCKDCTSYGDAGWCRNCNLWRDPDDFCSRGKRKETATQAEE